MKMATTIFIQSSKEHLELVSEIFSLISFEASQKMMCSQKMEDLIEQISGGEAIIAFCDSEWVGYCYIQSWNNYSEICGSVVKPSFRKQGIGTALKKACLELALKKYPNKPVITLSHDASMQTSLKLGFEVCDKYSFDSEVWDLCCQCESFADFPDCQCIGMIYRKK